MERLPVILFLLFFVWVAWFVTVANFMDEEWMADSIKWAYSIGPVAAIFSPVVPGILVDRFFVTERVFGILHLIDVVLLLCSRMVVGAAESGPFFILILFLHTLFYIPMRDSVGSWMCLKDALMPARPLSCCGQAIAPGSGITRWRSAVS